MNSVRVFTEINPSPILLPNPDSTSPTKWLQHTPLQQAAIDSDFEQYWMLYDGTLNYASRYVSPRGLLDYPRPDMKDGANCDPINYEVARQLMDLACNTNRYTRGLRNFPLIVLDTEQSSMARSENDSLPNRRMMYLHYINAIRAMSSVHPALRFTVWNFPWTQLERLEGPHRRTGCEDLEQTLFGLIHAPVFELYNTNYEILSQGSHWFSRVQMMEQIVAKYCPQFKKNKIAMVTPSYSTWGNSTKEVEKLNGQPLPISLWESQIDFLKKRGWDIMFWCGSFAWDWKIYSSHLRSL